MHRYGKENNGAFNPGYVNFENSFLLFGGRTNSYTYNFLDYAVKYNPDTEEFVRIEIQRLGPVEGNSGVIVDGRLLGCKEGDGTRMSSAHQGMCSQIHNYIASIPMAQGMKDLLFSLFNSYQGQSYKD